MRFWDCNDFAGANLCDFAQPNSKGKSSTLKSTGFVSVAVSGLKLLQLDVRPSKKKLVVYHPRPPRFSCPTVIFLFFILRKTGIREGRHTILVHSIEMSKKVVQKESQQVSLSTVSRSPLGGPLHAYGRQTCSSRFTVQDQFSPSVITAQLRRTLLEEHGKEIQQFSLSTVSCSFGCLHTRVGAKHVPVDLQYSAGFVLRSVSTGQLGCTLLEEHR